MLSFIQQRLGKSPTKSQKNMTRQDSIESAFARVNARNVSKDASATPSLTTAASSTDTCSEPTDTSEKLENQSQDVRPSRMTMDSDEENVLSEEPLPTAPVHNAKKESYTVAGETMPKEIDSQEQLLQEGVQALDEDWNIGAMPGDGLNLPTNVGRSTRRRRSMRFDIIDQTSTAVEITTSALGKRGRKVMEAGMEKIQAWKGSDKRSSRRPTDIKTALSEEPRKRARFSTVKSEKDPSPRPRVKANAARKRSKHWVAQGLYVGQSPDFDARLTEAKNKMKKVSKKIPNNQKSLTMPLPMFAGERTLALGRDFKLPFDVFSPLPPGQPKPDEWKKTHKSKSMNCQSSRAY